MPTNPRLPRFILLPSPTGRAPAAPANAAALTSGPRHTFTLPTTRKLPVRILDTIRPNGPHLIEAPSEALAGLRAAQPGLTIVPLVYYQFAAAPRPSVRRKTTLAAATQAKHRVRIISAADQQPIANATVIAFSDYAERAGDQAITNKQGYALLETGKVERLYVYPPAGHWPLLERNATLNGGSEFALSPVDRAKPDALSHFYQPEAAAGKGVRVAVIDSGAAAHDDLQIAHGECTVPGETAADYADYHPQGHGTHVCGIVAARLAPGVDLHVFRVCAKGSDEIDNYSLARAIDRAVANKCDLINLSISGGAQDPAVRQEILRARTNGVLVIAANGNDGHQPVGFPASDSLVIGVSAMGRKGTFPPNATQADCVQKPYGKDRKNFVAAFSNIGENTDFTAPGVGVVSTVPGGWGVMDGTSMACPAVTGMAARLLSTRPEILKMKRGPDRATAIAHLLSAHARSLGFGPLYEGQGMLLV